MTRRAQNVWLGVVMPVHRPCAWLDEALASIPEDEGVRVIIRDSTPEGSASDLISRHADRLDIDYEYLPDIPSWTRKTNIGVQASPSDHVCTLHQDDFWLPGRLDTIRALIAQHPDAALYLTGSQISGPTGNFLGKWRPAFSPGTIAAEDFRDRLVIQNSIAMPSPVFRRDAYLAAGGLDETLWYTPDWDLWFKLGEQGTVVFDETITTAFRIHGTSQTMSRSREEMREQMHIVLNRYAEPGSPIERIGRASAEINTALARAASGKGTEAIRAVSSLARLGPIKAAKYLRYSTLIPRLMPRLKAFAGRKV